MTVFTPKVQLRVRFGSANNRQSTWPTVTVHKLECRNGRDGRVVVLPPSEPNIDAALRAYEEEQRAGGRFHLPGYHPCPVCFGGYYKIKFGERW